MSSTRTTRKSGARRPGTADRVCRAHLQLGVLCAGAASAPGRAAAQRFGEDVYVHQLKLKAKAPSEGDVWQWHQDYGTWARDDGMPELRAMNIAVFLDAVMAINGPLFLIRKGHRADLLNAGHDKLTTSYPL